MTHLQIANNCPACRSTETQIFYRVERAPTHSVLLHKSRQEALEYPTGAIQLAFCEQCGFIFNTAYNPALQNYHAEYESTQSYSPTFDHFSHQLAQELIDRHDLRGKEIIEIGCGMGEFLSHICGMGGNRGLGFDPAHQAGRVAHSEKIRFIRDFYSEQYAHHHADFVICKMTLEHIGNVAEFVDMVRAALTNSPQALVYFQVPDTNRVLEEIAFWDIYYEHCSYFTANSLRNLFQRCGFEVLRLERAYDNQYLMIEARLSTPAIPTLAKPANNPRSKVTFFQQHIARRLSGWRNFLAKKQHQRQRVMLWGGGSKAVAFLTTLGIGNEIEYCVDINPHKRGTFTAGSGHEIIAPEDLKDSPPDVVIVLNPIYIPEIRQSLKTLGLVPDILSITTSF
ncbi:MAG: methyltransferase domain-containing protein [Chloroflexi bacterium]|jgi:2-polyprenyl-3-methyl-5-hydroxy-6-metoxy-1,4-benzoquinol methylase|nr:methyltransferase domain-containing protein [Chloroflexota bacterium]